jgi:Domain of unknown function (DUF4403)
MKIMRTYGLIGLAVLSLAVFGCASIKVPAPDVPVTPMPEAVVEDSTINVLISVSASSLSNNIKRMLSRNKQLNQLNKGKDIEGMVQDLLKGQTPTIDADALDNAFVRLAIGKAWDALQAPIPLNYKLSLLLNPQTIQLSPPNTKADTTSVVIGVVARPKLISSDTPQTSALPLPNVLLATEPLANGFHIAVDSELSFDFIGDELTKKLEGKEYPVDGSAVSIQTVRVYGSGDSLVLEVRIRGAADGVIYLIGKPRYDESTRIVSIQNLDYTVETKHVLVKTADWLLHSTVRDNLAEKATWYVGDRIDAAQDMLSEALNRKLNRYVSITGKVRNVRVNAVGMTAASLKAVLVADGTVSVSVF